VKIVQWIVRCPPESKEINELVQTLKIPEIIAQILINRGIKTIPEARRFFQADWEHLNDPFLMLDMEKAVDRIIRAIKCNEQIFIYGDYDVDGITSVSLLTLFFEKNNVNVIYYIPDRLKEGYGLSKAGVQQAARIGATLLISVDCGITAFEEVALAKELGIDVIISDHHEPSSVLPNAHAILDPKRKNCNYPFKELAGVGVAYKIVQAIVQKLGLDEEFHKRYIDLVALGSAADIVPLIHENRLLVKKGMEKLNQHDHIGIRALVKTAGLVEKKIGTGQIVFMLAPRINAVGRLGNAERAVRLLVSDSEQQAKNIANIMESENLNRKSIDEDTFQEAIALIEEEFDINTTSAIVLARKGWHSGVIGIVASRIVEKVFRPTIMISLENGIGRGSARSIPNFDIYSALKECEEYLLSFGGHRYAAGLTIEVEQLDQFSKKFRDVAAEMLEEEDLIQKITIDSEINLSEITDKFVRLLRLFAPFGPQNMRPVFLTRKLQVVGNPQIVGKNHLKFKVRQEGQVFDVIGFNLGSLFYRLTPGEDNLDMVYVIEENQWEGHTKIQLRVKDLR
jgi:single-stranded-DNA-specific exonuclease